MQEGKERTGQVLGSSRLFSALLQLAASPIERWKMLTRIRVQPSTDPHQVRPDRVHSGAFDGLERIRDVAERLRHLLLPLEPMRVDEDLLGWWE